MNSKSKQSRVCGVLSVGVVGMLALAGTAAAQCNVYRLGIQDFDQRRAAGPGVTGLPGNGSRYCTPTSGTNWLAYIGTHGYPQVLAPQNWQAASTYQAATDLIGLVGAASGAGADSGAWPEDVAAVLQYHLDATAPGEFATSVVEMNGTFAPSPKDIYDGMSAGQLMCFSTSHWSVAGPQLVPYNLPQRFVNNQGGHTQTISRVYNACGLGTTIWTRDPADPNDGVLQTQSVFRSKELQIIPAPGYFTESADSPVYFFRYGYRFYDPNNPNPSSLSFLRALMIITPKCGLSANAQQGQVSVHNMHNPDDMSVLPMHTHTAPNGGPIIAMKLHPQFPRALVLTRAAGQEPTLFMYHPADGTFDPMGEQAGASSITIGRSGQAYLVKSARIVVRIDFATPNPTESGSVQAPGVETCGYDDATDTLLCVAPSRGVIGFTSDAAFGADYVELPLPPGVVLGGTTGCATWGGTILLSSSGQNAIYVLTKTGAGTLVLNQTIATPQTVAPKNLQVDHRGNIVFTSNGIVRELRKNTATGGWEPDPASKFAGLAAGDFFEQLASRSTAHEARDPAEPVCDSENQSLTGGIDHVDCPADFDGNEQVNVQDIFGFLAGWFGGNLRTDFDLDGDRDVQDIFAFLNAWFAGC